MIGKTIGKYRIVGQIGRGGAGIVYRAIDETLNREVAIKTLNPDLANSEVMKRFHAEATTLARLNHPHIATIYELFHADDDLLMVMEFVRGETLDQLAQRLGPMAPENAAYVIDRILSGLEHAHRAGIVHRDMKPANVMVTEGGGVKIMDFGIARVRGAEQLTVEGRLMGTPAYMPPEQVLGQEVDGRADLYSVGVAFYRLLTGALPFNADTPLGMMQRQILETPTPMSVHRPGLPDWCEPIVQRALAKAPEDRYQTAEELREHLRSVTGALLTGDFSQAFAIRVARADTLDLSRVHGGTDVPASSRRRPLLSRRLLLGAAAALAFMTAGAMTVAYIALQRQSSTVVIAAAPPRPAPMDMNTPAASVRAPELDPAPAALTVPVEPIAAREEPTSSRPLRTPSRPSTDYEPLLVFETKTLVGTKKPREHDAQLVLTDGKITVTSELESEYPFYAIPYRSVVSITYSHSRDPLWNSPDGPLPLTRGGGALGRFGISVARDWVSLRTNTRDQFIAMRFEELLIKRVLLALEERTGRKPSLIAEVKEPK